MKQAELKIVCQYSANGENIETIFSESFRMYLYRELQKFASGPDNHVSYA